MKTNNNYVKYIDELEVQAKLLQLRELVICFSYFWNKLISYHYTNTSLVFMYKLYVNKNANDAVVVLKSICLIKVWANNRLILKLGRANLGNDWFQQQRPSKVFNLLVRFTDVRGNSLRAGVKMLFYKFHGTVAVKTFFWNRYSQIYIGETYLLPQPAQ